MVKKRLGFPVTLSLLLVLLITVALFSSCEDVISNTVPPFMPYVIGEIDLSGALPRTSRETVLDVVPGGPSAEIPVFVLLVRPDSAGPDVVLMLEGTGPTVRVRQENTDITRFDTRAFRHFLGNIQIGNLLYNPVAEVLSNAPRPERDYRAILARDEGYQLYGLVDRTELSFESYDSAFIPTGSDVGSIPLADVGIVTSGLFTEVDARFFTSPLIHDFFLFGYNDETERGESWYFGIDYREGETLLPPVRFGRAGLIPGTVQRTPAGFLGLDGNNRLVRMDLQTGAVLDTFTPRRDDHRYHHRSLPVVFDPQGRFYLLLDEEKRILYKVEPWW